MILLKPFSCSIKLRAKEYSTSSTALFRDLLVLTLLFTFSGLIFLTSRWILQEMGKDSTIIIPPEIPLVFSFNIFFPMIFFAALSGVISHFFYSEDLELLLASPISRVKFFFQRFFIVALETSWMSIISILPFLLSFATFYHASSLYYFLLPVYLVLFILIPSAIAILFGIIWALVLPRIPGLLMVLISLIIGSYILYELLTLISAYLQNSDRFDPNSILGAMSHLVDFGSSWSPATWLAKGLAPFLALDKETATETGPGLYYSFLLCVVAAVALLSMSLGMAYILFIYCYQKALALVWGRQRKIFSIKRVGKKTLPGMFKVPVALQHPLAIFRKEALEFFRDPSQLIQTFFLLAIIGLYVYLLRFQQNIYPLIRGMNPVVWERVLLLIHLILECFITVAMFTRLLFPAISREGRAIWILQKSPLKPKEIVIYKFLFWGAPIAIIVSVLSGISFQLQFHNSTLSILKMILSFSMATAVAALAVYLGSRFSHFSWENRSQLVASFGSLIFMVTSLLLAGFTILFSVPLILDINHHEVIGSMHILLSLLIVSVNTGILIFLLKEAGFVLRQKLLQIEI